MHWMRKAVCLARRALQVVRTDGPVAVVSRTACLLANRFGILTQQQFSAAMTPWHEMVTAQWQEGLNATLTEHQRAIGLMSFQLEQRQSLLERRIQQREQHLDQLQNQERQSLRWLAEHHSSNQAGLSSSIRVRDDGGPLISVILPVWNRRELVAAAVQSVLNQTYENWELLVVDDGSTDGSGDVIRALQSDSRIRLLSQDHEGVCRARNLALHAARGEIITYLDSDNEWFAGYLAEVARTFVDRPEADCAYAAQLVEGGEHDEAWIRSVRFDRDSFAEDGVIDLNVFAHRRKLVDRLGGFDEQLTRLVDWDLIIRYTREQDPAMVPAIGGNYRVAGADSISSNDNFSRNRYLLRRKYDRPLQRDLRVLYVVANFPQLTESYIRWEIECMQRWGVHVEVWSASDECGSPYETDVPVHYGSLDDAIRKSRPHLAHVDWLHLAAWHHDQLAKAGLQITIRGHGFEFNAETATGMLQNAAIQRIYLFPHYHSAIASDPRIRAMPAAFNGDLYYPPPEKDPFLVVRVSSAKPTKGLETFIDAARLCPQHRFVLILGTLKGFEPYVEEVKAYNERLGSPVEIRVDVPAEDVATLVRQAGIYLHTYGTEEPFGMPISIAEAMATGALLLARALPGAEDYIGETGTLYTSAEHAARVIRSTTRAYGEQWRLWQQRSVERAYRNYADAVVLRPLLDEWLRIADLGIEAPQIFDELQCPEIEPALRYLATETDISLIDNFGRSYLSHVVGSSRRAHEFGGDAEVRKAAVCHSTYIDNRISPTEENRALMRSYIGERAERLAYAFCAVVFLHLEESLDRHGPLEFPDQLAGGKLRISADDFEDLCLIHLAEWTEKRARCPEAALDPAFYRRLAARIGGRAAEVFEAAGLSPENHVGPRRAAA